MATPRTVAFHTLGCKLNFSETSTIRRQFEEAGFGVLNYEDGADYYVLNTCSVTDFADRKCRYEVRRAQKYNPSAKVIVVGCYAQLKPEEIADIDGVDLVLGAAEKFNILQHIDSLHDIEGQSKVRSSDINHVNSFIDGFSVGDRTRSFLKVQDGCNYKCAFCTIPLARGKSRSDTIENVIANAKKIALQGVNEIVLTGVNIGDFGNGTEVIEGLKPKKEALFIDLIKALNNVEDVKRFRISSIEPNLCNEEIIDFVASSEKFMPHFHMPLQSGSNEILKNMRRRYKRELYEERVSYIKSVMPHCCIGVDVIVGFPGETEEHFQETYDFLLRLDISYLHVFTYSERANTYAIDMDNPVPMNVRKERNKKLRILSDKKRRAFYESHIDTVRSVLLESQNNNKHSIGFTDNYIKVQIVENKESKNQIIDCHLRDINSEGLMQSEISEIEANV